MATKTARNASVPRNCSCSLWPEHNSDSAKTKNCSGQQCSEMTYHIISIVKMEINKVEG